jgi:hypothetical protein
MSDDRNVKKSDGRRKAERPKLRWLDCIANNLKSMVSRDGGIKEKTESCGLSFLRRQWLNCKERMSMKKKKKKEKKKKKKEKK